LTQIGQHAIESGGKALLLVVRGDDDGKRFQRLIIPAEARSAARQ
jgi:hypothetical protein